MSDLKDELARLIARASSPTAPAEVGDEAAVALVQQRLPAGVGAPAFHAEILERVNGTLLPPNVYALQAAYEVIESLLKDAEAYRVVIEAAKEFDLCLAGDLPASAFSEKQKKLHQALKTLPLL